MKIIRDISRTKHAAGGLLLCAFLLLALAIAVCPAEGRVSAQDTEVVFPDSGLEAAIRTAIGKPAGTIYQSDVAGLTALNAEARGIVSIAGIESCGNLSLLYLDRNNIEDVTPLSDLGNLTQLNLFQNRLTDLSPLSGLTALTYLDVSENRISDVGPLAGLTSLSALLLADNQIADVAALAGLTGLRELKIEKNAISDIAPLAGLVNLAHFYAHENQIADIAAISNMPGLKRTYLDSNRITALPDLSRLIVLNRVYLNDNLISDIAPLAYLPEIRRLRLGNNGIADIAPLVANQGLAQGDELDLRGNPLSVESRSVSIPRLEARGVVVTYDTNRSPDQPANLLPADGATGVALDSLLQASAFADQDGQSHAASQWQVSTVSADYSSPVLDSVTSGADLTSFTIPGGLLSAGTIYHWRVRYQDSEQAWSEWSAETSFSVRSDRGLHGWTLAAWAAGGVAAVLVLVGIVVFLLRPVRRQ